MEKTSHSNPIVWFGRFIIFLFSSGYIFPHICTEGFDWKAYKEENDTKKTSE